MNTINRESTTDAPVPVNRVLEREFVLTAFENAGALVIAQMITDLYTIECIRCKYSNLPKKDIGQWVKDVRFESAIKPYGLEKITQLVKQLAGVTE